ncbi:DNA-binding domain-containing protein [Carboxylicivirga marina]|uniref:DUF4469 domain-containing protein n=1 Tax=Carboxylicivirga marina TaxID=2800988 RepID=A0ABS1HI60_9BACT|nr:DNA-binding domain-containing protein [Carboxylicivirga marina]MBK3516889.1 DUF4469 domain-containing protein [Carboxylicivirga marina]
MRKLNLWLYDNHLTEDPNDYFGKVKPNGTITNRGIAQQIREEGSEFGEETIYNLLTLGDKMKARFLAEGYTLNTPLCYGHIGVSGVFEGSSAKYENGKHKISASFTQGSELRKNLENVTIDVLGVAPTGPVIGQVHDSLSGKNNSTITPNNVIKISGNKIKIDGDLPEVGLFLINAADGTKTKVEQLIENEPKQVIAMVPKLTAGEYELEIVTQHTSGGKLLKETRDTRFEHLLLVE